MITESKDDIRYLWIPFVMLTIGNLIVIAALVSGEIKAAVDVARPFWVVILDGVFVALMAGIVWPRLKKDVITNVSQTKL